VLCCIILKKIYPFTLAIRTNIKVTKKEDLETVEQYLKLAGRI
jgi:hypothetical protein